MGVLKIKTTTPTSYKKKKSETTNERTNEQTIPYNFTTAAAAAASVEHYEFGYTWFGGYFINDGFCGRGRRIRWSGGTVALSMPRRVAHREFLKGHREVVVGTDVRGGSIGCDERPPESPRTTSWSHLSGST